MYIRSAIEQLGYSSHEARVYLAALGLGGSTATEIAEQAHMPRTTVNLVIESLHRKGLMDSYLKSRRKIWTAQNPDKLLTRLKENETILKTILPELKSLRHDTGVKPIVRTYLGTEEIKQIMNDMLETRQSILAIFPWNDWITLLGKRYVDEFIERRVFQNLHIRLIVPKTAHAKSYKENDSGDLRVTRFLPDSIEINNTNFIYGNKVAIISIKPKQSVGILIEDKDIHHTMEVLFRSLWEQSQST